MVSSVKFCPTQDPLYLIWRNFQIEFIYSGHRLFVKRIICSGVGFSPISTSPTACAPIPSPATGEGFDIYEVSTELLSTNISFFIVVVESIVPVVATS